MSYDVEKLIKMVVGVQMDFSSYKNQLLEVYVKLDNRLDELEARLKELESRKERKEGWNEKTEIKSPYPPPKTKYKKV